MIRIAIVSIGTLGDIQPFFALARELEKKSYDVVVVAPSNYYKYAKECNIKFFPIRCDYFELVNFDIGRDIILGNIDYSKKLFDKKIKPLLFKILQDTWAISRWADVMIYYRLALRAVATVGNMPPKPFLVATHTVPIQLDENNVAKHSLEIAFIKQLLPKPEKTPIICAYRQDVFPIEKKDKDLFKTTGFWFLDHEKDWEPPLRLKRFLESGSKPVYIGFGSMLSADPEKLAKTAIESISNAGFRGILASGWGGLAKIKLPKTMLNVAFIPHSWLFNKMKMIVHHGGVGTIGATLRAGLPGVICPVFGDQFFNGAILKKRGLISDCIPQKQITVKNLSAAIYKAATDRDIYKKTSSLGIKINQENGVKNAVKIIKKYIS